MANIRFETEIESLNGIKYKVQIYDKNYTGSASDFSLGSAPLIKFDSAGADKFNEILASKCELEFVLENSSQVTFWENSFRSSTYTERDVYIFIYQFLDTYELMWTGYILQDLSTTEDVTLPKSILLQAVDGLSILKEIPFVPNALNAGTSPFAENETYIPAGTSPTNADSTTWGSGQYHRMSLWIAEVLGYAGVADSSLSNASINDYGISISANWYNTKMDATEIQTNDTFFLTAINARQFYKANEASGSNNDVNYNSMSCYDALRNMLRCFGSRIFYWNHKFYVIQIGLYATLETGTTSSPQNIKTQLYNKAGVKQSSGSLVGNNGLARYFIQTTSSRPTTPGGLKKLSGTTYDDFPVYKKAMTSFTSVSNLNLFNSFVLIPGQTNNPPSMVGGFSGGNQIAAIDTAFEDIGTFTDAKDFTGFFVNIFVKFKNGSGSGNVYFFNNWTIQAKPNSVSSWDTSATLVPVVLVNNTTNAVTLEWHEAINFSTFNPNTQSLQFRNTYGKASAVPSGHTAKNPFSSKIYVDIGQSIRSVVANTAIANEFNFVLPTASVMSGDWDFRFFAAVHARAESPLTLKYRHRGHGVQNFNPTSSFGRPPFAASAVPTLLAPGGDGGDISYQVMSSYNSYQSAFAVVSSGQIASYASHTNVTLNTDASYVKQVPDTLWGDTLNTNAPGSLYIDAGSSFEFTSFTGQWGKNTLSGTDSLTELLLKEVLFHNTVKTFKGNFTFALSNTNRDFSSNTKFPKQLSPLTIVQDIDFSNRKFVMLNGSWNLITNEVAGSWFEYLYDSQSTTVRSIDTGIGGTVNTGGGGTIGVGNNDPIDIGSSTGFTPPSPSNLVSSGFINTTSSSVSARLSGNVTDFDDGSIAIKNRFNREPFTFTTGVILSGAAITTIPIDGTTVQADTFKQGDILLVVDNVTQHKFTIATDVAEGATSLTVSSTTLEEDIPPGAFIYPDQDDLYVQYQHKSRGSIGNFQVSSTGMQSGSVNITSYIDDDSFGTASANSLATSESIKAYVDGQTPATPNLQQVTTVGNTTTNSITFAGGTSNGNFTLSDLSGSTDPILHIKDVNPRIIKLQDANYTNQYATIGFDDGHLKFSSDPDNQRANSVVLFKIDNSERMRLTSDGKLGVGITNPFGIIHGYSTSGIISESPGNATIIIRRDDNVQFSALLKYHSGNSEKWVAGLSDAGDFTDSTGNEYFIGTTKTNPIFLINSSGNVGIGTTSPDKLLEIFNGDLKIGDNSNSARRIFFERNTLDIGSLGTNNSALTLKALDNNDISLEDDSGNGLIVKDGGNVLIGTTTDDGSSKLQVNGAAKFTGNILPTFSGSSNLGSSSLRFNSGFFMGISATSNVTVPLIQLQNKITQLNKAQTAYLDTFVRDASGTEVVTNLSNIGTISGTTATFTGQVTIPATPVASTDAASKGYVDAQVGASDTLQEVTDNGNTTTNSIMIGSSSAPSEKLHVTGNIRVANNAEIFVDGTGDLLLGNTNSGRLKIGGDGTNTTILPFFNNLVIETSRNQDDIIFKVGDSSSEIMRIDSSTNQIGIGVSSPHTLLNLNDNNVAGEAQFGIGDISSYYLAMGHNSAGNTDGFIGTVFNNDAARFDIRMKGTAQSDSKLTVLGSGNVGIGTSSPNRQLQVKKTTGTASIAITSSNTGLAQLELGGTSDNDIAGITYNGATSMLSLKTNNTGQLYVTNSGNVLLGTTTDNNSRLRILGGTSDSTKTALEVRNSSSTALFTVRNDGRIDASGAVNLTGSLTGTTATFSGQVSAGTHFKLQSGGKLYSNASNVTLQSASGSYLGFNISTSEKMRLNSTGLGIGTTSPTRPLTVHKSSAGSIANFLHYTDASNFQGLYIQVSQTTDNVILQSSGNNVGGFEFQSGNTTKMTLTSGGNLLIGTTTDSGSSKLQVSGNIKVGDSNHILIGNSSDFDLYHTGTNSFIENWTGDLYIRNNSNGNDVIFQSDDGSGGVTTYITLDGIQVETKFHKATLHFDNVWAKFGNSGDLRIYHDGSNSYIEEAGTGVLVIASSQTNMQVDGANKMIVGTNDITILDNIDLDIGTNGDLSLKHDGTDSFIENNTGDLKIIQKENDADIRFFCDDGTGSVAEYFKLDGLSVRTTFFKEARFNDNVKAKFGTSGDLEIMHNGNASVIDNLTGGLLIRQFANGADITLQCDDGSGGIGTYLTLDGGLGFIVADKKIRYKDNVEATFGDSGDARIYHTGSSTLFDNFTGNLAFTQNANGGDIIFNCDNGTGGTTSYITLDGGAVKTLFYVNSEHQDNVKAQFGNSGDLGIFHNGSNSFIINDTGDLYIRNTVDDKDIIFQSNDGSGGITSYFAVDSSITRVNFYKNTIHNDNVQAAWGSNVDFRIEHDGTNTGLSNFEGDLIITQNADGKDIIFKGDNGSGGVTDYIRLDGSQTTVNISQNLLLNTTTDSGGSMTISGNIDFIGSSDKIHFKGSSGGNNEGILYKDSGGSQRYGLLFPGSDVVALANRAANGTVQIRANTSTAGTGGEVTVAEFEDSLIKLNKPVQVSRSTTPSDPPANTGVIYLDSNLDLKIKINGSSGVVTRTLALYES